MPQLTFQDIRKKGDLSTQLHRFIISLLYKLDFWGKWNKKRKGILFQNSSCSWWWDNLGTVDQGVFSLVQGSDVSIYVCSMLKCHLSAQTKLHPLFASWKLSTAFASSPVRCPAELILWAAKEKEPRQAFHNDWCHLPHFHLPFKVMDKCRERAKGLCHQDVFLNECSWHLTSWWGVTVSVLAMARQGDRLWLVSQKVVKLQDGLCNVCWHGDQLGLLEQLVINEAQNNDCLHKPSFSLIKHNTHSRAAVLV